MKKILLLIFILPFLIPQSASAGRLFSSGFELQSVVDTVEFEDVNVISSNPSINTTTKRSGLASLRFNQTNTDNASWLKQNITASGELYTRFYIKIVDSPNQDITLLGYFYYDYTYTYGSGNLNLDSTGHLELWGFTNGGAAAIQKGSDSASIDDGDWHMVEMYIKTNATTWVWTARLDGSQFATGSATSMASYNSTGIYLADFRGDATPHTHDFYIDDIAVNNTTGSVQNSWPGTGSVVHMQVDGNGDAQEQNAGDWDEIEDVIPDDGTYLQLDDANDDVYFTLESSSNAGIDSYDTITLVQAGYRHRPETAASSGFTPYLESKSAGTKLSGTAFTHNDTTWKTNGDALPRVYNLTSYTDPDTAAAWTPTGVNSLDNMQIGGILTDAAPDFYISSMWALVEYVDGSAPATGDYKPQSIIWFD